MRKEVIFAILIGGALGLTIAFGIWRANMALSISKNPVATSNTINQTSTQTPNPTAITGFDLTITSPEENAIIKEDTAVISGQTAPNTTVAVISDNDESIVVADATGKWEAKIKLAAGPNQIDVSVFSDSGDTIEKQITIVYSTEIKEK